MASLGRGGAVVMEAFEAQGNRPAISSSGCCVDLIIARVEPPSERIPAPVM